MNYDLTKNTWRAGTTSVNRTDLLISLKEIFFAFDDFKKEISSEMGVLDWKNKKTMIRFTDFASEKYPWLFESNKDDKAQIARQITALLVNYGLVDERRENTKYGNLFLKEEKWINPISNYFDIDYYQTVLLMSLINKKSDNGLFEPFIEIIKYLFKNNNSEIKLTRILATHKALNSEQFNLILGGKNPVDLLNFNFSSNIEDFIIEKPLFLNNNGKKYNLYIKNIYKVIFEWFNDKRNLNFHLQRNEIRAYKKTKSKVFNSVGDCFRDINKDDISLVEMNNIFIKAVAKPYFEKSYIGQKSQTIAALRIMGIFNFSKRHSDLFIKIKNSDFEYLDFEILSKSKEEIIKYFKNKKSLLNLEEKNYARIVSKFMDEFNIFEYFEKDELYLIPNFPSSQLEAKMKRYVFLEWLVGIKLTKIFNLNLFYFFDEQRLDENGILISHRPGLNPDFEYNNTLIEVTTANGINVEKLETEPVTRHLAKYKVLNPEAFCLFFGAKDISLNFYWDAFAKRKYRYYHNKSKSVLTNLNIIVCEYTMLDYLKFDHIDKLLEMHKQFEFNQDNCGYLEFAKIVNFYKEKLYEISSK